MQDELEGKNSSDESSLDEDSEDDESSDDDHTWTTEMKKQHRIIEKEHRQRERMEVEEEQESSSRSEVRQPTLFELRQGEQFTGVNSLKSKINK